MLSVASFFDISEFGHAELFKDGEYAWNALSLLKSYMADQLYPKLDPDLIEPGIPLKQTVVLFAGAFKNASGLEIEFGDVNRGKLRVTQDGRPLAGASVIMAGAVLLGDKIKIGQGVLIESGAFIKSPVIIGDRTEVRQGAYLRGHCLIGAGCVAGHVTEVKHSIFLNGAKAGHFAYLGDSIIGNQVNLGAGTKLANLRFTGGEVPVKTPGGSINTGLRKLGAILGDHTQTGCNSVTNPGTLLGRKSLVLPNRTVPSGYHRENSLIK